MDKFKVTAKSVGTQATAFAKQVGTEVQTGGAKALVSFKLENEASPPLSLSPLTPRFTS